MHENLIRSCIALIKQVPRAWFDPLRQTLQQWGFRSSVSDSLFYSKNNGYMLFKLVYVDDILITGSHSAAIHTLIHDLYNVFALKNLGSVHYFLGFEVLRTASVLHLRQAK